MDLQNSWLKNRRNQVAIFLLTGQIYMILGIIVPTYEKIPYYAEKISVLKKEHNFLENKALHIEYYHSRKEITANELNNLKVLLSEAKDSTVQQEKINKLLRQQGIKIISQQIKTLQSDSKFNVIRMDQIVQGTFTQLKEYLAKIETINPFYFITQCNFNNLNPLKEDPVIDLNMNILAYIPKEL